MTTATQDNDAHDDSGGGRREEGGGRREEGGGRREVGGGKREEGGGTAVFCQASVTVNGLSLWR